MTTIENITIKIIKFFLHTWHSKLVHWSISMTEPSNSVPGSSDKYAQLSTAGNFKIIWDLDKIYCAMWVIISVIIHKDHLTQTDNHQFPDKLFWSCCYYPNQTRSTTGFKYLIQVHFYFNSREPLKNVQTAKDHIAVIFNPFNKRTYILKQNCIWKLQVCLGVYDIFGATWY